MEIRTTAGVSVMKSALDQQQQLAGSLISSTIDRLNTGMRGLTPVVNTDYQFQKDVLSAAYAEKGVGTKIDTYA